jgi:hypothetical protein
MKYVNYCRDDVFSEGEIELNLGLVKEYSGLSKNRAKEPLDTLEMVHRGGVRVVL